MAWAYGPPPDFLIRLRLNGNHPALRGTMSATPRRKNQPLKVYCLDLERRVIEENARTAGLSVSRFLRAVGSGSPVQSVIDQKAVRELAKINADQGRLGGLLKALLTNDERLDGYSGAQIRHLTEATLTDIKAVQVKIRVVVDLFNATTFSG